MSKDKNNGESTTATFRHASPALPAVTVDTYNEELREADGFVGDRASGRAFRRILDEVRAQLDVRGHDPLGHEGHLSKSKLDKIITGDDALAAGMVHTAVEEFAKELAGVVRRFQTLKTWRDTERIVIGGGLIASHIGMLAMGRAGVILAEDSDVKLCAITNHPDEAGLVGAVQLAPSWVLTGHDAIVALDIGGTNVRAGLVELKLKKGDVSKSQVHKRVRWRHANDKPTRDEAVDRIADMLKELIALADAEKLKLAPFIGVACPGLIDEQGTILRGGQNLPGNWEGEDFHLPAELARRIGSIGDHDVAVVMHNDAVVQGLSEVPNMKGVEHWGVLTIGTGLGNACFTNR